LRLSPDEEKWLWDAWGPSQRENNPVFGRLDALVDFISPMWKDTLRFVQPHLGGIGGRRLIPTAREILADGVLPGLLQCDSVRRPELGADIRELLMQEVLDHAEAIGRPLNVPSPQEGEGGVRGTICFVEPKYAGSGPDEQEALAQYFRDRHGLR